MKTNKKKFLSAIFNRFFLTAFAEEKKEEVEEVEEIEQDEDEAEKETDAEESKEEKEDEEEEQKEVKKEKESEKITDPIAKARQEEKDKLYGKIKELETHRNKLLGINAEKDKEINKLKEAVSKLKDEKTLLESKVTEVTEASENKNGNETVEYQELYLAYTTLEEEFEKAKVEHEEALNKIKMDGLRETLITKHAHEIIPELVQGETEQEILDSLKFAKKRYKEIVEPIKRRSGGMPDVDYGVEGNKQEDSLGAMTLTEIQNLTPSEWAQVRKDVIGK